MARYVLIDVDNEEDIKAFVNDFSNELHKHTNHCTSSSSYRGYCGSPGCGVPRNYSYRSSCGGSSCGSGGCGHSYSSQRHRPYISSTCNSSGC